MAFTWETLDKVTASSYVEMKNAVNSLTDRKLASRFNWQSSEPAANEMIAASRYDELQSAADYADDVNVCNSENAANYITKNADQNSADDSTQDVTQDAVDYATNYTTQDVGYDGTLNSIVDASNFTAQYLTADAGYDSALYGTVDSSKDISYYATQDVGYDAALNVTIDSDQHGTYHATADNGYDSTLYGTVDSDQHGGHYSAQDSGYDSTLNTSVDATQYGTVYSSHKSGYCSSLDSDFNHSCFTGGSLVINQYGDLVRVDSLKAGDRVFGAKDKINTVIGVEKVPVGNRVLYRLNDTFAKFTGEHPFLLANGRWGSFDKTAMDWELFTPHDVIIDVNGELFNLVGDMSEYDENTITPISNGDLVQNITGKHVPINAKVTTDSEEFIYTMFMDGDRTWNIEGVVVSGLALAGENTRLEKYIA